MLVVGGMGSVSGAVTGTCFLTVIYVFFQRFEVNGIGGTTVPTGTADVVMALALLIALILRPKGLTAGREIPWPGDWRRLRGMRRRARGRGAGRRVARSAQPDHEVAEVVDLERLPGVDERRRRRLLDHERAARREADGRSARS